MILERTALIVTKEYDITNLSLIAVVSEKSRVLGFRFVNGALKVANFDNCILNVMN